jgi:hypothetical protein
LIYAVGPSAAGDSVTPMRTWPTWCKFALVAVAMLVVGCGSGMTAILVMLAPTIPTGAADQQMRQPPPSHVGQTSLSTREFGSPAAVIGLSHFAPPKVGQSGRVGEGTDGANAAADPQRLRCRK